MRGFRGMSVAVLAAGALAAGCARVGSRPQVAKAPQEDVKAAVEGNNAFAVEL